MDAKIQLAKPKDIPAVKELIESVDLSTNLEKCRYIFKATLDREIVGTASMEYHGQYAVLRALVVREDLRRQGIGSALMWHCIAVARKDGMLGVYFLTEFRNVQFFHCFGFKLRRKCGGLPKEIEDAWQPIFEKYKGYPALGLELEIDVQLAEPKDLPAIEELIKSGNLSTNLEKCRYVLKACLGDKIVGTVGLEFWGDYVSLRALIVVKPLRKQGIGGALVRRTIELARKDGALAVYAYTLFWNNNRFRSWGFERVDKASVPEEIKECVRFHDPHYKYCCAMELKIGTDPVEETIKCYEATAEGYARGHLDPEVMREQLEFFIENLQGKKVLDVGCGPGRDARFFNDQGLDVVGIDPAEKLLRVAQRVAPEAMFLKMDMRALDFPPESFDGLWACASFLHIPKKEALTTLQGFRRVLKPNGLFYLSVKEGEGEGWQDYGDVHQRFFAHYRLNELVELIEKASFEVFNVRLSPAHALFIDVFARPVPNGTGARPK